jgi:UDP-4-amino-4,6-dideoxy-N-acetyl-beta-L-altrosamine N-acetyltransferase
VLRDATADDLEAIRRWRNHPDVRAVSFTTHEIGADEHLSWWRAASADPSRRILVYERFGVPSGVVTLADLRAGVDATWGFYLDIAGLEERGELLPAWLEIEREVVAFAFDELGLTRIYGEMLASNQAVRSLHRRFGFTEAGTSVREVDGQPVEVVTIELLAENRRRPQPRPTA